MSAIVEYKGLRVLDPAPTGPGGRLLQDDLKTLADRVADSRYLSGLDLQRVDDATIRKKIVGIVEQRIR